MHCALEAGYGTFDDTLQTVVARFGSLTPSAAAELGAALDASADSMIDALNQGYTP